MKYLDSRRLKTAKERLPPPIIAQFNYCPAELWQESGGRGWIIEHSRARQSAEAGPLDDDGRVMFWKVKLDEGGGFSKWQRGRREKLRRNAFRA